MVKQPCSSKPCCQQDTGAAVLKCIDKSEMHCHDLIDSTQCTPVHLTLVNFCTSNSSSLINQSTSSVFPLWTAKWSSVHSSWINIWAIAACVVAKLLHMHWAWTEHLAYLLPVTFVLLNEVLHHCKVAPGGCLGERTTRLVLREGNNGNHVCMHNLHTTIKIVTLTSFHWSGGRLNLWTSRSKRSMLPEYAAAKRSVAIFCRRGKCTLNAFCKGILLITSTTLPSWQLGICHIHQ